MTMNLDNPERTEKKHNKNNSKKHTVCKKTYDNIGLNFR